MIILLPLLRRLSFRSRLAVGIALIMVGLVLIVATGAHGVIAVIIGGIFLLSCSRGRLGQRLSSSRRLDYR